MHFTTMVSDRSPEHIHGHLLIVIDDIAYSVEPVRPLVGERDGSKLIASTSWKQLEPLFPWLEEQPFDEFYRRYTWLHAFLEQHASRRFTPVPENMVVGVPKEGPPDDYRIWDFYSAGTMVLNGDFARSTLLNPGESHRVPYHNLHDEPDGTRHFYGTYIWTNDNGRARKEDVPDRV